MCKAADNKPPIIGNKNRMGKAVARPVPTRFTCDVILLRVLQSANRSLCSVAWGARTPTKDTQYYRYQVSYGYCFFGELQKHFSNMKKKNPCSKHKSVRHGRKMSPQKSLSLGKHLQNPKRYGIISFGCRSSGCIGVLVHFYAGLSYYRYGSLPFCLYLYYTAKSRICQ